MIDTAEYIERYYYLISHKRKWRDIDKAVIKEDFLRQIVEHTTGEKE